MKRSDHGEETIVFIYSRSNPFITALIDLTFFTGFHRRLAQHTSGRARGWGRGGREEGRGGREEGGGGHG